MAHWFFEEQPPGAPRRDPQEAELFKAEQSREGEYAGNDQLVREILQNALDARAGDGLVTVRLAVHEENEAPKPARLAHYFERLCEPLEARQIACNGNKFPTIPCRFIVCEDFGTRGLEGDVTRRRDPPKDHKPREDFYWFWRNIGRSAKTGDDLGRWGLGKTVFRAASRVRSMFGLTRRQSDGAVSLMGQAVLQSHTSQGKDYIPEGYWCAGRDTAGLPLPITDKGELDQFWQEWKLSRQAQAGLSVVVPFLPAEVQADRLLQAVAVHFFTRILRGELAVEVAGQALGAVTLNSTTIEAACKKMKWDGHKRHKRNAPPPVAFARKCFANPPAVVTEVLGRERVPIAVPEDCLSAESLAQLRQQFAAGALTSLGLRVWLPRRDGAGMEGRLDVYLQRDPDGERCETYYIREGMTISKLTSRAAQHGIQALVNVDPGPLAKLLGDTEGPAHEDWLTNAERPDQNGWQTWKGRIKFLRSIVDSVVEVLTPPTTEPDFNLLADFFSIPDTSGPQSRPQPGDDKKDKPKFEPLPVEWKWFHITARPGSGGFTISRMDSVPMPANAALKVSVAYDLPRGDPLRNWSNYDFQIGTGEGQLRPQWKGVKPFIIAPNMLRLADIQESFTFSVEGFDRHRDLYVRVDELTGEESAS